MNKKTVHLLKNRALEFSKERNIPYLWAYNELRKLWLKTPKDKKHTLGL